VQPGAKRGGLLAIRFGRAQLAAQVIQSDEMLGELQQEPDTAGVGRL